MQTVDIVSDIATYVRLNLLNLYVIDFTLLLV